MGSHLFDQHRWLQSGNPLGSIRRGAQIYSAFSQCWGWANVNWLFWASQWHTHLLPLGVPQLGLLQAWKYFLTFLVPMSGHES